jgi:hypothetical protein
MLIGKAKELYVATLLVAERLHVYIPLVDNGFDLMVTSSAGAKFLSVQVKYKNSRTGFSLRRADAARFEKANAVIAFGTGEAGLNNFYFFQQRIGPLRQKIGLVWMTSWLCTFPKKKRRNGRLSFKENVVLGRRSTVCCLTPDSGMSCRRATHPCPV